MLDKGPTSKSGAARHEEGPVHEMRHLRPGDRPGRVGSIQRWQADAHQLRWVACSPNPGEDEATRLVREVDDLWVRFGADGQP